MTLAPPERPTLFDARTIDMRCAATAHLASPTEHAPGALRCQLLAGHGGEHALMFAAGTARQVAVWSTTTEARVTDLDWRSLAWMRGMPAPAWFETGENTATDA